MKILVIDDQAYDERHATFEAALKNRGHEVEYLTALPGDAGNRDWQFVEPYDLISWDNDLGNGVDIVEQLAPLFWQQHDLFEALFSNKQHVVHSANGPAAASLMNMFEQIGADVRRIPIHDYNDVVP